MDSFYRPGLFVRSSRAERRISQSKRGSHELISVINQRMKDPSHSLGMTMR